MTRQLPWTAPRELQRLPETLRVLADLTELRGELMHARSLRHAADTIAAMPPRERRVLARGLATDPDLGALPLSLPPEVAEAARLVLHDGAERRIELARQRIPRDLNRLLGLPDVSLEDLVALHRRFGVISAADVAHALTLMAHSESDVAEIERAHRIEALLPQVRPPHARMPLGRAWSVARGVIAAIEKAGVPPERAVAVGSLRRFEPTVGDIEILVRAPAAASTLAPLVQALAPSDVLHLGARAASIVVRDEQVTLRAVGADAEAAALVYYTGSPRHVRTLQARARQRQLSLTPTGLFRAGTRERIACRDEAELYARLGLAYVPPELRHGLDEVARAERHELPPLVTRKQIRGDLHTHTLWSDGHDSVESMVYAARALKYEYVAITDHSQRAAASRVLTLERLARQREDVERVRRAVAGITILHGCEVDIMPDGSLDFPDAVLEGFDVVLASLHDAAGQPPEELLARYMEAMRHPLVGIITHPANRLPGRHEGYALDFDALFAEAAATGTALEVDGGPGHLDLDGALAGRAVAAGVTLTTDSDCHNAARLDRQMRFAVGTARRGGVSADQVLNTRPWPEVQSFFAAKRRKREAPPC